MHTARDFRVQLGRNLRTARGAGSVHSAGMSGVGYRTVDRMERATKVWVELSAVYLLAVHYQVDLGSILSVPGKVRARSGLSVQLRSWPAGAPSLPETDAHVRRALRELRLQKGWGTPRLAELAGQEVHQAWIVRLESGEVRADVIRIGLLAQALGTNTPALLPPPFMPSESLCPSTSAP